MGALLATLLRRWDPLPGTRVLLAGSALAFFVAGFEHLRLVHRGFGNVAWVGPLFVLAGLGTAVVILLLLAGRPWLYVLGCLSISVGAMVSIVISHTIGFLGFREEAFGTDAAVIFAAEAVATVLALAALGALARERRDALQGPAPSPAAAGVTAFATVALTALAAAGIGMGDPPSTQPAPTGAALRAGEQAIAAGGPTVARGRKEFFAHGCDACHAIAAVGATGALGPRLDTSRSSASTIVAQITQPASEVAPGYARDLMPRDYLSDIGEDDVRAIAAFVAAASARGG